MVTPLTSIITAEDNKPQRDLPLEKACSELNYEALMQECSALDTFWREEKNLYRRVRTLFFLYAIYRFHLPKRLPDDTPGLLPHKGYEHLLNRRFREAIDAFLKEAATQGMNDCLCSALSKAYMQLGLQNLADQVRSSVRSVRGNQWMFRTGHPEDHPLRIRPELYQVDRDKAPFPIIHEQTAVRMDLSHSAWSDIFFLGMDYPEGARVLNTSVNLGVYGRDTETSPPVEGCFRIIDAPVVRLTSVDLGVTRDISDLDEIFDFAKDYLGLLKAAIIASGIIPIGMEGSGQNLQALLKRLMGPNLGFELVSSVNNIPKGSRLAVSTNLLGALIAACMRATSQTRSLSGPLEESERRIVAARAILGEWLGGSGGGWQDSGGVWPGIKTICGCVATEHDPEFGISKGRLLPQHTHIDETVITKQTRQKLQESLVLVHGGMAQNVGPILEMVSEKYLLRSEKEWHGRQEALDIFEQILETLKLGDIQKLGSLTTQQFFGPLQTIIPWATNLYTETLIRRMEAEFGDDFWGFWMLGGMAGGGMGFIFSPEKRTEALEVLHKTMLETKRQLENSLPFAMDPVVYTFSINENGSSAVLKESEDALMPSRYYPLILPGLLKQDYRELTKGRKRELDLISQLHQQKGLASKIESKIFENLLPTSLSATEQQEDLDGLLAKYGFDSVQHEVIRRDLQKGRIGMAQNRLPLSTRIEDVKPEDITNTVSMDATKNRKLGEAALAEGKVAVVTLAAGAGSRWTEGAGVVKALHPFSKFAGRHRNFLEVHLAKSRKIGKDYKTYPAHIFTTSYLTHAPIEDYLQSDHSSFKYEGPLSLSFGQSIGLRLIPTERDLRFAWEETAQQVLDERAQKVKASLHEALIQWARTNGEAHDYRDNLPAQCLHPVGHWYEIPNLLLNGTLVKLLEERPQLETLMLHNIDTLGAHLAPEILGRHLDSGKCLSFEVITRRLEDRGGGLAQVDGKPRLVEGLAFPNEEDEFKLSYYNSMTTWISLDKLLDCFKLKRSELTDTEKVAQAVRDFAQRMPTYITIKEVKKRWGHGQEDIFPITQFEKLWSDMSSLNDVACDYFLVPRLRGLQLKEQAQLDGWLRDGSAAYVDALCHW